MSHGEAASRLQALARGKKGRDRADRTRRESDAAEVRAAEARRRLVELYARHAPEKAANVDALLGTYRGREDELLRKVGNKYGVMDLGAGLAL